jgi:long-chain acyl-CoA synthetase
VINKKTQMKEKTRDDWGKIQNLPGILPYSSEKFGTKVALSSVGGLSYTYSEAEHSVRFVASMLHSTGIGAGDRVALLGENSPHWVIAYFGILACGAVAVPVLPDFQEKEISSILEHAGVRALFVSGKLLHKLKRKMPESMELTVNLNDFSSPDLLNGIIENPENSTTEFRKIHPGSGQFPGEEEFHLAQGSDLASIIYTSGTTGRSKGVMLSHDNILSNAKQSRTMHEVVPEDRFLSMLPLAHTYECTIGMVVPLLNGARIHYIDRPPTATYLAPVLRDYRPTTMLTVPLVIEKIYFSKIKPALYGSSVKKALMKFSPVRRLLSRVAAGKLKEFFGGALRFFGVGGAPLSPEVERFLLDGRFPYAIGYGLTETSPLLAGFNPENAEYMSVGKVLNGVSLKILNPDPVTGEGEFTVRGHNVMQGYYQEPEMTRKVFTEDGWFRTGDLGTVNRKGTIYIRGRLKNMILGPNGENIYPEEIEALINSQEGVSDSLVMQVKGKLVARVHLNIEFLEERFKHLKENATDFQQQIHDRAQEVLNELMVRVNEQVARNSRLQKMILQVQPFEKTPTQKIKRFLYT